MDPINNKTTPIPAAAATSAPPASPAPPPPPKRSEDLGMNTKKKMILFIGGEVAFLFIIVIVVYVLLIFQPFSRPATTLSAADRLKAQQERYATIQKENSKSAILFKGETNASIPYSGLTTSPDKKSFALLATTGGKQYIIHNKKKGKEYDKVSPPKISPDGKRVAYVGSLNNTWYYIVDGKEYPVLNTQNQFSLGGSSIVNPISFTTDSKDFIYLEVAAGTTPSSYSSQYFVNGIKTQEGSVLIPFASNTYSYSTYFSLYGLGAQQNIPPDFTDLAILQQPEPEKLRILYKGVAGDSYDEVYNFNYSPDGKQFSYVGVNVVGTTSEGYERTEYTLVLNNQKISTYEYNYYLADKTLKGFPYSQTFSPDSKHLAYVAYTPTESYVMLDSKKYPTTLTFSPKHEGAIKNLTFSSDGNHLAFQAVTTSDQGVFVVDGKPQTIPKEITTLRVGNAQIGSIVFSPNGNEVSYVLTWGTGPVAPGFVTVVKNGAVVKTYLSSSFIEPEAIESISPLVYSPDSKHIAYAVLRDNRSRQNDTTNLSIYTVLNGKESLPYKYINSPFLLPDDAPTFSNNTTLSYDYWKDNSLFLETAPVTKWKDNSDLLSAKKKALIETVSKLVTLPTDETPVSIIRPPSEVYSDTEDEKILFSQMQYGDADPIDDHQVLIYFKNQKIFVYNPGTNDVKTYDRKNNPL